MDYGLLHSSIRGLIYTPVRDREISTVRVSFHHAQSREHSCHVIVAQRLIYLKRRFPVDLPPPELLVREHDRQSHAIASEVGVANPSYNDGKIKAVAAL